MNDLPEYIDRLPNICGSERQLETAIQSHRGKPVYLPESRIDFGRIRSAFAIALHMHQPLIPAGGDDLRTAEIISNLKYMMDNPGIGDNHNAPVFHWCYKRMGEFIPQLMDEANSRASCWTTRARLLTDCGRWGCTTSSTTCGESPVTAATGARWNGWAAPGVTRSRLPRRRRIFACTSGPGSIILPRSSVWKRWAGSAAFLRRKWRCPIIRMSLMSSSRRSRTAATDGCWCRSTSVERPENGPGPERKHLPHRLVCRNSRGEEASIIALIKTQGSDTKLVAQMQPYYEAKGLSRWELAGQTRAAAGGSNRRWRERRRDDERIPSQVH